MPKATCKKDCKINKEGSSLITTYTTSWQLGLFGTLNERALVIITFGTLNGLQSILRILTSNLNKYSIRYVQKYVYIFPLQPN